MLLFMLLLQASDVATPNPDYSTALSAWSACAEAAVASPKQMMPAQGIEAFLAAKCMREEQEFHTRFAAFVRADGDPTRRADDMAKAETDRLREHLSTRAFHVIEARQFLSDAKVAAPWLACLRKARATAATYRAACLPEQNAFVDATRQKLMMQGTSVQTSNQWLSSFIRRMRQKLLNEAIAPAS